MLDEEKAPEVQGQPTEAPVTANTGQADGQPAPLEDKFAGKSTEEVLKSYNELQKKLGEQATEVGELRSFRDQMDPVLQAVWADPELYQRLDDKIKEQRGFGAPKREETKKDGEQKKEIPAADLDTRRALENQIIADFERKYGVDQLAPNQKREMHVKIGNALADLADPGGRMTYADIVNTISLQKLPRYLENAYFIANKEALIETAKLEALTANKVNQQGSIGSIPSSSGMSSELELSASERETAQKMGIPVAKYLARKKEILETQKGV